MYAPLYAPRPVGTAGAGAAVLDAGLRRYMLSVYNYMAAGLGVTGLVAYAAVATGFYQQIAATPLIWVVMLAPLAAVLFLSLRIEVWFGKCHLKVLTEFLNFGTHSCVIGIQLFSLLLDR